MRYAFPSPEFDEAVAAICHGTATEEQMRAMNALLRGDPGARDSYLLRVELHSRLASEPDLFFVACPEFPDATAIPAQGHLPPQLPTPPLPPGRRGRIVWNVGLALAACLAVLLSGIGWLRRSPQERRPEATSRAVAMLHRAVDARWNPWNSTPRLGAPLEPGRLRLESGLVQIVFYNGARVAIEGPADFELVSPAEAVCTIGRLTADVPPQARGFQVSTPGFEVIGLGTSFGLKVGSDQTELHVLEGTVEYRTDRNASRRDLGAGRGVVAEGSLPPRLIAANPEGFSSLFALQTRSVAADSARYGEWRRTRDQLRNDPSLWIHFDFEAGSHSDWRLPNVGSLSGIVPDATIVGCQWQEGRWATKPALEFRGVSDRVRLTVPEPCESLTLAAWVRVQGLDRPINSLFMSDGFLPGTVHWLIRNDGVLGLTVIGANGKHQILASPPVLTVDQFGMWTHLAVVLDSREGRAIHYVNGQPVSHHPVRISPPFELGTAELGNWNAVGFSGNDPFLIRNFSGVMDEFCLFGRALDDGEIQTLYTQGRPQSESSPRVRP